MTLTPRPSIPAAEVATTKRIADMLTAQLAKTLGYSVLQGMTDRRGGGIVHLFGVHELHSAETWPRIILVADSDRFGPATMMNGPSNLPIKPTHTRYIGFAAYFHGEDSDAAEMMANDYVAFLHGFLGASVQFGEGRVVEEDPEHGDATWLKDGAAYRLTFTVAAPVAPSKNYVGLRNLRFYTCSDEEIG